MQGIGKGAATLLSFLLDFKYSLAFAAEHSPLLFKTLLDYFSLNS